jgi:hypothetical protein
MYLHSKIDQQIASSLPFLLRIICIAAGLFSDSWTMDDEEHHQTPKKNLVFFLHCGIAERQIGLPLSSSLFYL